MRYRVKGGLDNAMGGLLKREEDRPLLSKNDTCWPALWVETGTGALAWTDPTASL